MAQIVAAQADELTQQGQLTNAESWLRRAPTMVWGTQVVYGDIAARRHQWRRAAQFYNQAIDLIADPELTPQAPSETVIKKIYRLAHEAQLLSSQAIFDSSGEARGPLRSQIRGVEFKNVPTPVVRFDHGQTTLDDKSQQTVQQLATYLNQQNIAQLTLIGHTDSTGSGAINTRISKQRALAVKQYLQQLGVTTHISVESKGKSEHLQLANLALYTPKEINALNRRVEFVIQ